MSEKSNCKNSELNAADDKSNAKSRCGSNEPKAAGSKGKSEGGIAEPEAAGSKGKSEGGIAEPKAAGSKGKSEGGIAERVMKTVQPFACSLGLSIWDIRFVKEGAERYLRIFIDREGGVGIDDCVDFSRAIDGPLDEADLISGSYCLEVSSPGCERELTRDRHFEAYKDRKIKLRLIRPDEVSGEREIKGSLSSYKDGLISILTEAGEQRSFNKKDTAFVRADDSDEF